jgi:hypothetical protein
MAGKKALGSWDVNDKRTKAGKEKQLQTNGVKMFDSTVSIASGLFKTGKKKNTKTKSNNSSYSSSNNFEYEVLSEEEIQKRKEKDKKSLPYMIILGVVSIVLVIFFWLFIISLF